jgi:16S rRNA (cytosine1402-N4)-methyltransferase
LPDPGGGVAVRHIPVLLAEVLAALQPKDGGRYIDCTFGAGGYTRAILNAARCEVLALDRDPHAIRDGEAFVREYESGTGGEHSRLILSHAPFSEMEAAAAAIGWDGVDGIVFDLGVSSMQLDEAERGFSFMRDGPLDMRMSQSGPSAADIVNTYDRDDIADILFRYGDERRSRTIAAAIVKDRDAAPFTTTLQLAGLVERILGRKPGDGKHPATRTFQALRIAVNDEIGELERGLAAAQRLLKPGGRLAAVTFHSLEDRIVKAFLAKRSGQRAAPSRHLPDVEHTPPPTFALVQRNGVPPAEAELAANPRARSARLRAAIKLG